MTASLLTARLIVLTVICRTVTIPRRRAEMNKWESIFARKEEIQKNLNTNQHASANDQAMMLTLFEYGVIDQLPLWWDDVDDLIGEMV